MDIQTKNDTATEHLLTLFEELTTVSGVSGNEKQIADLVKQRLKNTSFNIVEDDVSGIVGGNQGNLIIVPADFDISKRSVAFLAHLDTVRDTSSTKVVQKSDRIMSAGSTQLGADNRWGLTLILEMISSYKTSDDKPNVVFVCTVGEEKGMLGAKQLDLSPWNVDYGVVLDSSLSPGSYIKTCAGMSVFEAEFIGRAAHSAVSDGDGISAISMASKAILEMAGFKAPADVTFNIGEVRGGTSTNVIPDKCIISGEVRAFNPEELELVIHEFKEICQRSAGSLNGKVEFRELPDFAPYQFEASHPLVRFTEKALGDAGLEVRGVQYSGGSDANALNSKGIAAVNLGIGARNPHSDDEYILLDDVRKCKRMIGTLQSSLSLLSK